MPKDSRQIREELITAGRTAAEELINVAKAKIIKKGGIDFNDDLAADKMKNAAAAKKLAIFDAFDILSKVDEEERKIKEEDGEVIEEKKTKKKSDFGGFAENRAK